MRRESFQKMMRAEFERLLETNNTKGRSHADDQDALVNFKRIAERRGLAPEQVLGVKMDKHLEAIDAFTREGVSSESLDEHIHDAILYLLLLKGLLIERVYAEEIAAIDAGEEEPVFVRHAPPSNGGSVTPPQDAGTAGATEHGTTPAPEPEEPSATPSDEPLATAIDAAGE